MDFFSRKAAPQVPAANGNFNQRKLDAASNQLKIALQTIANQHVKQYAKIIRKNAETKARIGYVPAAALNAQAAAERQAAASTQTLANVVPGEGKLNQSTANAASQANNSVNALIKNISNARFNTNNKKNVKVNNIKRDSRYSNVEENRIQAAIANRRKMIATFI